MNSLAKQLTPEIFWDVNISDMDDDLHRRFIIQRVLERGTLEDFRRTRDHYTLAVMVAEAQKMRHLEPKALAFIACLGNVPEESFRCYTPPHSIQKHWSC